MAEDIVTGLQNIEAAIHQRLTDSGHAHFIAAIPVEDHLGLSMSDLAKKGMTINREALDVIVDEYASLRGAKEDTKAVETLYNDLLPHLEKNLQSDQKYTLRINVLMHTSSDEVAFGLANNGVRRAIPAKKTTAVAEEGKIGIEKLIEKFRTERIAFLKRSRSKIDTREFLADSYTDGFFAPVIKKTFGDGATFTPEAIEEIIAAANVKKSPTIEEFKNTLEGLAGKHGIPLLSAVAPLEAAAGEIIAHTDAPPPHQTDAAIVASHTEAATPQGAVPAIQSANKVEDLGKVESVTAPEIKSTVEEAKKFLRIDNPKVWIGAAVLGALGTAGLLLYNKSKKSKESFAEREDDRRQMKAQSAVPGAA